MDTTTLAASIMELAAAEVGGAFAIRAADLTARVDASADLTIHGTHDDSRRIVATIGASYNTSRVVVTLFVDDEMVIDVRGHGATVAAALADALAPTAVVVES